MSSIEQQLVQRLRSRGRELTELLVKRSRYRINLGTTADKKPAQPYTGDLVSAFIAVLESSLDDPTPRLPVDEPEEALPDYALGTFSAYVEQLAHALHYASATRGRDYDSQPGGKSKGSPKHNPRAAWAAHLLAQEHIALQLRLERVRSWLRSPFDPRRSAGWCPGCGARAPEGQKACFQCGGRLPRRKPEPEEKAPNGPTEEEQAVLRKHRRAQTRHWSRDCPSGRPRGHTRDMACEGRREEESS